MRLALSLAAASLDIGAGDVLARTTNASCRPPHTTNAAQPSFGWTALPMLSPTSAGVGAIGTF